MATQEYRIVSGEDSDIHDEPHVQGSRITVRDIYARVEERGDSPATLADQFDLTVAEIYEALAYYHSNPDEMRRVEVRRDELSEKANELTTLTPPDHA